jgi:predicted ATP-grasp superfamily ATP-dependent carboligase
MTSMGPLPAAILVHEFVTGGGWPDPELPQPLAAEALAIVRAVLDDLRAWGRFPVVTTRDRRLGGASVAADRVVELDTEAYPMRLLDLARECGAVLLVAPESRRIHERLSAQLLDAGVFLLGSLPAAVAVAANKEECGRRLAEAGLPVPETLRVSPAYSASAVARLGLPVVVKPMRGAGCEGVGLVTHGDELEPALARLGLADAESLLVQRYVAGSPASVSLLVAANAVTILGFNTQRVRAGVPFEYEGGVAAVAHRRRTQACELARKAVALVPGLRGYVGVDLVVGEDGCWLIEINPRLTTSYVGLRRVVGINMAAAMWQACWDGTLPWLPPPAGAAAFGKGTSGDF